MTKRKKLVLIDGNSVFHRGYHALPGLTNSQGVPTAGIYGFATMTLKMLPELKPDYVVVAWDKAKTSIASRVKLYPQYKAHRKEQADDFYSQIPLVHKYVEAMGWPLYELDNYEADDIIGTLAREAERKGLETVIVTGDLDSLQLLDTNTKVWASRRGLTDATIYDLKALDDKYGLNPEQFIDLKALKGDASDNIPGVPGVGEKTALDLLHQFGSLDAVYDHLDETKGAVQRKLTEGKELAYLSKKLATIWCDAPVGLELDKSRVDAIDRAQLRELFLELDFKSLITKLPGEDKGGNSAQSLFDEPAKEARARDHIKKAKYHTIQTVESLESLAESLKSLKAFAFDTETTSVDVLEAKLVGMSFSFKEGEAYYVPVGHSNAKQLSKELVLEKIRPILENPLINKVGHNLKFDYQIMRGEGVTLTPVSFDTMIASFIVNPLARAQKLDELAYRELGIEMIPIEELIGKKGKDQMSFDMTALEEASQYAAEDADITWRLYEVLKPQLEKHFKKLAEEIEWPLIPVLAEMELAGVELDVDFLKKFNKQISARILELEKEIYKLAGEHFNLNAPAQLSNILFNKLGITVAGVKKGKSGALSTAAKELEKMRGMHPIVDLIFEYRELAKLKTTYVDALPDAVAGDGRVHTSFSQVIAQTGRLSSNNPNLQNIPIRTELGREIRKAFVVPKGRALVSADYSQIELRVAAALSKDQAMIKAFKDGIDIHQQTAAELYEVPLDKVTKEMRYAVKAVNFGVLYGMGAHSLAQQTGMDNKQASEFIKRYYELRPGLSKYIEGLKAFARKHEYTETLFGRRRPCPEINSNNFIMANAAERMAVNVPIQGTAADIMKLAMVKLAGKLDDKTQILLQIHDELIVECDDSKAEEVAKIMKETMESVYDLGVPIDVETGVGKNWGELK